MTTVLKTSGNTYEFKVYTPNGEAPCSDQAAVRRRVIEVALVVHALDPSPRETVIFHET